MRKYLTKQNIALACGVLSLIIVLSAVFKGCKVVNENKSAEKVLMEQQRNLEQKDRVLEERIETARKRDSLFFIELNKKRDENIKRIDTANNDLLRKLLSE